MSETIALLKGKKIWVTGASSGIGEQLALAYSRLGADLILSARRNEELSRVRKNCNPNSNVFIVEMDQSNESSVRSASEIVLKTTQGIDHLVLCGGISQRSLAITTPIEVDRKIFEVNFFANVLITKLVVPSMIQRGSGTIVVISSLTGKWGFYLRSAYSASKHALHGFFDSLRMEVESSGIQITIAMPGFIATEISRSAVNKDGQATGEMDPNQAKGMDPELCASVILTKTLAGKREFGVGGREILGLKVKRLFPSLFEKMLRKQMHFSLIKIFYCLIKPSLTPSPN